MASAPDATWRARLGRRVDGCATRRGALALFLLAVLGYAVTAAAFPLARGRDAWDYWLWYMQAVDGVQPFSELMPFRTPVAPLVLGIPMSIGGARLLEIVMAVLYAGSVVAWAWAVAPIGRRVAVAMGALMLVNVPYVALFHEVSSDAVYAALFAVWAAVVVRATLVPTTRLLVLLGLGAAALALCRPASQIVALACVAVPLVALHGLRSRLRGVAIAVAAVAIPLGLWSTVNLVRYDDFAVARGSKAWVPYFKVGGSVDPANGPASRRLARAVERYVLTLEPYRSRDVDVRTYFDGLGNLEVIRTIALSDRVFGWDSDYDVLFDASVEAIRVDPGAYARSVGDTFTDFLTQRYAPEVRERPVPLPALAPELSIGGKPFPAPITVSPLRPAIRYGLVWCPTDDLERCVVARPATVFADPAERARYVELTDRLRDWNAQLPPRDSHAWLAAKLAVASWRWPRSILWLGIAVVALAWRRPRGTAAAVVLMSSAALVLGVHALSQAPQNEFALPLAPVWIAAALVGLAAPRREPAERRRYRPVSR